MGATADLFAKIKSTLEREFELGRDVDAIERFEDEPSLAVETHIAELSGPTGSSILYGLAVEDPAELSASGHASSKRMALSIVIARRLGPGQMTAHGDDLDASDELMDRTEDLFNPYKNPDFGDLMEGTDLKNIVLSSRAPVPSGGLDWLARELTFDVTRHNMSM